MKRTGFKKNRTTPLKRTSLKRKDTSQRPQNRSGAPKSRKRTETITQLKKKLWEECKRIVRERHGNVCYTCYKQNLEKGNWQTGHFISSSVCSVEMRYDLSNLRPQCYHCNINLSGNWVAFEEHLKRDGIDVDLLKQRNQATKNLQYDILWYRAKLDEYRGL